MILRVLPDTHPKLRKVCSPVSFPLALGHKVHAMSLVETMKSHKAYGIASNQTDCGFAVRIIAVDLKEYRGEMINPVITEKSDEIFCIKEACLSSKQSLSVTRAKRITVSFKNRFGRDFVLNLEDLSAVVVQHEVDHLNGKIITDYL